MTTLLFISLGLQGGLLFFDEFIFHRRRGLPLWEKIGHPMDSLSVIICYLFLFRADFTENNLYIYIALAVFSCLLITKDEFIHKQHSTAFENWLHSVLFVLHPVPFFAAGLLWSQGFERAYFAYIAGFISLLFLYQVIFWSLYETKRS